MYLKAVHIKGFQSHEDTTIHFSPRTNGLVGKSNSGKSGIIRAIRWNLKNNPSGKDFIRIGADEATVITEWSDGHSIERTRGRGSKNFYILRKDGEILEEFTGFGSSVPKAISEVTNGIDLFDFNFADQLEAPFLLCETPAKRAEQIGNLEELGKIDTAIKSVNDDVRDKNKAKKIYETQIKEHKKRHKELSREIQEEEEKVEFLKVLKERLLEKQKIVGELSKNHSRVAAINKEVEQLELNLEKSRRVAAAWDDQLPKKIDEYRQLEQSIVDLKKYDMELSSIKYLDKSKIDDLVLITDTITSLRATYTTLDSLYERLKSNQQEELRIQGTMHPKTAALDLKVIDKEIETYMALFAFSKQLKVINEEEVVVEAEIDNSKKKIDDLLNQFVQALSDEKICPTCLQSTQNISKETISNNI